jgi:apolipoprotein N-acyltransferase
MTTTAATVSEAHPISKAIETPQRSRHILLAGMVSGFLLWTSFPPAEWSWLAWLALAPLFWLATLRTARTRVYVSAWLGGLVFWLLALQWLRLIGEGAWLGWVVMAGFFSLWWPAYLALLRWALVRLRLPLIVAAPIIWVALEYVRSFFLSGFPWFFLAHTQFRQIYVIQIADFAGALGISLLIAIVNALIVDLATLPLWGPSSRGMRLSRRQNLRLCVVTVLLGASLCYGAFRVSSSRFHDGPRLALLQSNIEQKHKAKGDPVAIITEFVGLLRRALAQGKTPDLIVWPETSYPYGFITVDPAIDPEALKRQVFSFAPKLTALDWLEKERTVAAELHRWTDEIGVPMLIGSIVYDHQPASLEKYNSAILFQPGVRTLHFYHKMHLVPFGEYFPLIESLPWLKALTPYRGEKVSSLSFGRKPICLPLGPYRLAVTICFEDTIPHVIRRFFAEAELGQHPDVLINLSNDGWFHGSSELDMHLAIAVFRAVEHRVPLARSVNTGLSALIDGNGEIRETLPKDSNGVLSVTVPIDDRTSCYSRWGDWLGLSCLAVTIGLFPLGLARKPRPRFRQN